MTERIVQEREAAIGVLRRRFLQDGPVIERQSERGVEIVDDEIQVNRRPMSVVRAELLSSFEGLRACRFEQQIDGHFSPQQLDKLVIETAADAEPQRLRVEGDGALHVVHVQIDQHPGHHRKA